MIRLVAARIMVLHIPDRPAWPARGDSSARAAASCGGWRRRRGGRFRGLSLAPSTCRSLPTWPALPRHPRPKARSSTGMNGGCDTGGGRPMATWMETWGTPRRIPYSGAGRLWRVIRPDVYSAARLASGRSPADGHRSRPRRAAGVRGPSSRCRSRSCGRTTSNWPATTPGGSAASASRHQCATCGGLRSAHPDSQSRAAPTWAGQGSSGLIRCQFSSA